MDNPPANKLDRKSENEKENVSERAQLGSEMDSLRSIKYQIKQLSSKIYHIYSNKKERERSEACQWQKHIYLHLYMFDAPQDPWQYEAAW